MIQQVPQQYWERTISGTNDGFTQSTESMLLSGQHQAHIQINHGQPATIMLNHEWAQMQNQFADDRKQEMLDGQEQLQQLQNWQKIQFMANNGWQYNKNYVNRVFSRPQTTKPETFAQKENGTIKKKRKRQRTAFTTNQILALERIFSTQPYIDRDQRIILANKLNIQDKAIKIWFQNRRMKGKRVALDDSDDEELESTNSDSTNSPWSEHNQRSPSSDLEYISSQIGNADANGLVTLDEKALSMLFSAIDPYVPENISLDTSRISQDEENNFVSRTFENNLVSTTFDPKYDPISPATADNSENEMCWEAPSTESERKNLLALHFC